MLLNWAIFFVASWTAITSGGLAVRWNRARRLRCVHCSYPVGDTSRVSCPECGHAVGFPR